MNFVTPEMGKEIKRIVESANRKRKREMSKGIPESALPPKIYRKDIVEQINNSSNPRSEWNALIGTKKNPGAMRMLSPSVSPQSYEYKYDSRGNIVGTKWENLAQKKYNRHRNLKKINVKQEAEKKMRKRIENIVSEKQRKAMQPGQLDVMTENMVLSGTNLAPVPEDTPIMESIAQEKAESPVAMADNYLSQISEPDWVEEGYESYESWWDDKPEWYKEGFSSQAEMESWEYSTEMAALDRQDREREFQARGASYIDEYVNTWMDKSISPEFHSVVANIEWIRNNYPEELYDIFNSGDDELDISYIYESAIPSNYRGSKKSIAVNKAGKKYSPDVAKVNYSLVNRSQDIVNYWKRKRLEIERRK